MKKTKKQVRELRLKIRQLREEEKLSFPEIKEELKNDNVESHQIVQYHYNKDLLERGLTKQQN